VVAGCGVAGLSAAVSAAEQGARVVVLERAPRAERGGQSRYTEAYLRMKSETEVSDDFETHLAENGGGPHTDPDLAQEVARAPADRAAHARALSMLEPDFIGTFATEAGPTIAWLKGMGVRFDFLPTQFLTKSQPRLLPVGGGAALVEALAARAESLGVAFRYEATALRLVQDDAGRVTGLVVREGGRLQRIAGQVVLACGGFEGNAEMSTRYLGPRAVYLRTVCKGGLFNRGEGIRPALLHRRSDGLPLPLRHPGEPRRRTLHRRGARHRGRLLRARDAPHPRAAGRRRLGGAGCAAHAHPELPPGPAHRPAAHRRRGH
jgi:tricarballylate dehydrogenase